MNAHEYRKTLTPKQADAFRTLLETKLRESGYYQKNVETNQKVMELQRQARVEIQDQFDKVDEDRRIKIAEVRAKIAELHEQEKTINEAHEQITESLWKKAHDSVLDEVNTIIANRGDAESERAIIESLAIAEYQKRLAKKAQVA